MNWTNTLLYGCLIFLFSCSQSKIENPLDQMLETAIHTVESDGLDHFILPESNDYVSIPQEPANPLTAEKVALGKMLFYETGLALGSLQKAGKGSYSCATCHIPSAGFMPGRVQGIADGGLGFGSNGEGRIRYLQYREEDLDVQGIRPLSLLNVAYVSNSTWSGQFGAHEVNAGTEEHWSKDPGTAINHLGYSGLESQNIVGLDLHRMVVNKEVFDKYGYTEMFDKAFPDFPVEERYSKTTTSFALSAYLRTLFSNRAPWQEWLKGNKQAMTDQEKRGALLFFGKARCFTCHNGPALNSMRFFAIGVKDLYETGSAFATSKTDKKNLGRGAFTGYPEDYYKFKVPQLYNLQQSPFYFHGSSKHSLKEVVEYFNKAVPENPNVPESQITSLFQPLNLTDEEIADLVSFLENGLKDAELDRYVPEEILSGNCFPNNDILSRAQLNCD